MMKHRILTATIIILTLAFVASATTITSAQNGNWNATTTWDGGVVPTSSDDVVIGAADTIIVDAEASCNNISFGGTDAKITMNATLSCYGNFTLFPTSHNVFSGWASGAKFRFTGTAETQIISGFSTTAFSTSFEELEIDKSSGKVTTDGTNMRLGLGASLEIVNGTFELAATDDIEGRTYSGSASSPTITIGSGGTFNMAGGASHIRRASNTGENTSKIGKMTIHGTANLSTNSSNRINFTDIDVEDGGTVNIESGWSTSNKCLNCGTLTIMEGGQLIQKVNTDIWYVNSSSPTQVALKAGGTYEVTSSAPNFPIFSENKGIIVYSRNISASDQTIVDMNYCRLEIKYSKDGAKKNWALTADRTIDSLATNNSANLVVTAATAQTITIHKTLRLTSGSVDNSAANVTFVIGDGAAISRATGSITNELNFSGTVDLAYTSTVDTVLSGPEIALTGTPVNNVTVSGTKGVKLTRDLIVNGTLVLESGKIFTEGWGIKLAENATLVETDSTVIDGYLEVSRGVAQNVIEAFSGVGLEILATGAAPGISTLQRYTGESLDLGHNGLSILRYFDIIPENNADFNATLVFHYVPAELDGIEPADLTLYQLSTDGTVWEPLESVMDAEARTVTASGINRLSLFTCGAAPNQKPVLYGLQNTTINEDDSITLKIYASDADGDAVQLKFISDTSAVTLDYTTPDSQLTMTPAADWNGTANIAVLATDGSDTTTMSFTLTVKPVNDSPADFALVAPVNGATVVVHPDSLTHSILFTWETSDDIDGDAVSYRFIPGGAWTGMSVGLVTETQIRLYVANFSEYLSGDEIQCTWTIEATDGVDTTAAVNGSFNLTIQSVPNNKPIFNVLSDITIDEDTLATILVYAEDVDGDSLSFLFTADTNAVAWNYIVQDSLLILTPAANWNGAALITAKTSDGIDTVTTNFTLMVLPVNDAPTAFTLIKPENQGTVTVRADSLPESQWIDVVWTSSSDVDGDSLTYIFVPGDDWAGLGTISTGATKLFICTADLDTLLSRTSLSCSWTAYVTDGIDTVAASDGVFTFTIQVLNVGIVEEASLPEHYSLEQNYPNPFNPMTTIRFGLPENGYVELVVYDALGRKVKTLVQEVKNAGYYSVSWNATNDNGQHLANGLYFCRVHSKNFNKVIKMIYLK